MKRILLRHAVLWMTALGLGILRFYIPPSTVSNFDKLLISLIIVTAGFTLADALVVIVRDKIGRGPMQLPATTLTMNLVRYAVLALAVLMIFSVLGIAVAPLLTALGVGSLAVALGLQETISNLFAGIYILKSQIIGLGDFIRLDSGQEGFVTDVGLRAVHLITLSNTNIYVPTSKISQSVITNFSHPTPEFTTPVEIQVDFNSDLEKVEKVTVEAAKHVLQKMHIETQDPRVTLRYHGYGDSGIQFTVFLRLQDMNTRLLLIHAFFKELTSRYAQNNIKLSLPQRMVHLEDGNR